MIGLGLRKGSASSQAESEVGMLDVSANALAVLILATMLVISAAAPPSTPSRRWANACAR